MSASRVSSFRERRTKLTCNLRAQLCFSFRDLVEQGLPNQLLLASGCARLFAFFYTFADILCFTAKEIPKIGSEQVANSKPGFRPERRKRSVGVLSTHALGKNTRLTSSLSWLKRAGGGERTLKI